MSTRDAINASVTVARLLWPLIFVVRAQTPLQWRHNERDGVSNHRRLDCLLNRLFGRRSNKTPKLCVIGLCEGNSPVTSEYPAHKGPVTRKMFQVDDVIMQCSSTLAHPAEWAVQGLLSPSSLSFGLYGVARGRDQWRIYLSNHTSLHL